MAPPYSPNILPTTAFSLYLFSTIFISTPPFDRPPAEAPRLVTLGLGQATSLSHS